MLGFGPISSTPLMGGASSIILTIDGTSATFSSASPTVSSRFSINRTDLSIDEKASLIKMMILPGPAGVTADGKSQTLHWYVPIDHRNVAVDMKIAAHSARLLIGKGDAAFSMFGGFVGMGYNPPAASLVASRVAPTLHWYMPVTNGSLVFSTSAGFVRSGFRSEAYQAQIAGQAPIFTSGIPIGGAGLSISNAAGYLIKGFIVEAAQVVFVENANGVWRQITDDQTAAWSDVSDSQTPGWAAISDTQDPDWGPLDQG